MMLKEDKEHKPRAIAEDLEATQIVSVNDLKELERLQLARAAEPVKQRPAVIAAGVVLGLVLAAALLAVAVLRSGGHS